MGVDISNLIKYRLERCKETIEEVELAIKNKKLHLAENRIYYSIFYLVSALALKHNFSTSKHNQLKDGLIKISFSPEKFQRNMVKFIIPLLKIDKKEIMKI